MKSIKSIISASQKLLIYENLLETIIYKYFT